MLSASFRYSNPAVKHSSCICPLSNGATYAIILFYCLILQTSWDAISAVLTTVSSKTSKSITEEQTKSASNATDEFTTVQMSAQLWSERIWKRLWKHRVHRCHWITVTSTCKSHMLWVLMSPHTASPQMLGFWHVVTRDLPLFADWALDLCFVLSLDAAGRSTPLKMWFVFYPKTQNLSFSYLRFICCLN